MPSFFLGEIVQDSQYIPLSPINLVRSERLFPSDRAEDRGMIGN